MDKERLQTLLLQKEKIWGAGTYNVYCIDLGDKRFDYFINDNKLWRTKNGYYPLESLFEKEEDAIFEREIRKTKKVDILEFPSWDDLTNSLKENPDAEYKLKTFLIDETLYAIIIYNDEFMILMKEVNDAGWDLIFSAELDKENYYAGCRKAIEIFLGDEIDESN